MVRTVYRCTGFVRISAVVFESDFDIEYLPHLIVDLIMQLKDCTYITKREIVKGKIPSGYDDIKEYVV